MSRLKSPEITKSDELQFAAMVRNACLDTALEAYERAGFSGLCGDGRWELAVQAISRLDVRALVEKAKEGRIRGKGVGSFLSPSRRPRTSLKKGIFVWPQLLHRGSEPPIFDRWCPLAGRD